MKKFLQLTEADFQSYELFDLLKIWEHFVVYTCIEVFQKRYDNLMFIKKRNELFLFLKIYKAFSCVIFFQKTPKVYETKDAKNINFESCINMQVLYSYCFFLI